MAGRTNTGASKGKRPGVNIHKNGDAKIRVADAPGVTEVEPGVIALTWATIRDLYEQGSARRDQEAA